MTDSTPPVIETTPHPAIVAAETPLDAVNVFLNNPPLLAIFRKYAGDPNGLLMSLAASALTYVIAHYGLKIDPAIVGPLTLAVAAAFGYGWQIVSKLMMPATPVTTGVTR